MMTKAYWVEAEPNSILDHLEDLDKENEEMYETIKCHETTIEMLLDIIKHLEDEVAQNNGYER